MPQIKDPTPTRYRLTRSVVLIGMMGSGKTAIGRELAQRLRVPFLDSDHEIEHAANASIAEIFARDGERFFRDREAEVISRLLSGPPIILSTGGGAWLRKRNRRMIREKAFPVLLDADLDLLWSRVRHRDTRPLLRTADPFATLSALFTERRPIYAKAALAVRAEPGLSIPDMGSKVLAALSETDVLEPIR